MSSTPRVTVALTFRAYAEALYAALAEDPFYSALERAVPEGRDRAQAMHAYYDCSIAEAVEYGRVSTGLEDGVGVSVWSVPLSPEAAAEKSERKAEHLRAVMGPEAAGLYAEINRSMAERTGPLVQESDWYLSILGVAPAFQGQGRGAELMQPVLTEADRGGVASYLESFTPRNVRFYERLGYRTVGEVWEPVIGARYWVLRRVAVG